MLWIGIVGYLAVALLLAYWLNRDRPAPEIAFFTYLFAFLWPIYLVVFVIRGISRALWGPRE